MDKNTCGWILIIVGICILVSIVFPFNEGVYFWINIIGGIIVTYFSFKSVDNSYGISWLSGVAGYWMFWAAFIPGLLIGSGMATNNIIIGLIVLIVGLYERRKDGKSAPSLDDIYKQKSVLGL